MICGSSSVVLRQLGLFLRCVDLLDVRHLRGCETLSQIIAVNYKFTTCTTRNEYLPLNTLATVGIVLNYSDRYCFDSVSRSESPLNLIYRTISVKEGRAAENRKSQQMSSYIKLNALGFSSSRLADIPCLMIRARLTCGATRTAPEASERVFCCAHNADAMVESC